MDTIELRTHSRCEVVEITGRVQDVVARSGMTSGVAVVTSAHTTAGMTVNEHADPDVMVDLLAALERLVPRQAGYKHVEGNSDAHIKASLVGVSAVIPVEDGSLVLGTWQGIYFCEFDGPRSRRVTVQALPAA